MQSESGTQLDAHYRQEMPALLTLLLFTYLLKGSLQEHHVVRLSSKLSACSSILKVSLNKLKPQIRLPISVYFAMKSFSADVTNNQDHLSN
jgi:hypothetical protein